MYAQRTFSLVVDLMAFIDVLTRVVNYCCPIKVRKGISRELNHRIEAVELPVFDFQAPP